MAVIGIVAEYNPLHNGHIYHIRQCRDLCRPEAVVCVMSGGFTQRGEPALVDKWARAEMALAAGVDLVFELPVAFAARSANHFARGALLALAATGIVTHICFGSECGDLDLLRKIASVLNDEPESYRREIKSALKEGESFPAARSLALVRHLAARAEIDPGEMASVLEQSNNILGIEYLRVLESENLALEPLTVKRHGAGYHQSGNLINPGASFIRREILAGRPLGELSGLPSPTRDILDREFKAGRGPADPSRLFDMVRFQLLKTPSTEISDLYDVSEGLENRIKNAAYSAHPGEMADRLKTKRYSSTRLTRILLYACLGLTKQKAQVFDVYGPLYLRLLGFSPQGRKILHEIRGKSGLPLISRLGSLHSPRYSAAMQEMLALDCLATDLQAILFPGTTSPGMDYRHPPVIV